MGEFLEPAVGLAAILLLALGELLLDVWVLHRVGEHADVPHPVHRVPDVERDDGVILVRAAVLGHRGVVVLEALTVAAAHVDTQSGITRFG